MLARSRIGPQQRNAPIQWQHARVLHIASFSKDWMQRYQDVHVSVYNI